MLKKTEIYHKLIMAVAACFAEKGFSAMSVRETPTRAEISQGVMYTYFKSRDEPVKAIILEEQDSALTAHNVIYVGFYFDRLRTQVTSCTSETGYPITRQLQVEIMAKSVRNPELRKTYISSDDIMWKSFVRLIQENVAAGEFRRDINLEEVTIIIFALTDGLITRQAINTTFLLKDDLPMFFDVMVKLLKQYQAVAVK